MEIFIKILCLVLAVVLHELSHGLAAYSFGDTTAKQMGRLSLNPIKHIDPLGSIILPFLLFITNAPFLIGWAKPVPVDFSKLHPKTLGTFLVAFAGPITTVRNKETINWNISLPPHKWHAFLPRNVSLLGGT
jgi:Zn-dependent protease